MLIHWPYIDKLIKEILYEDIYSIDHTAAATIAPDATATAQCKIKAHGVIAGMAFVERLFQTMDTSFEFDAHIKDGDIVHFGDIAFHVSGNARSLLSVERTVLNVMQRMSGIASQTARLVDAIEGTGCQVLDTRKTAPLLRVLDKWAVEIGGGVNHRFGLFDMILIKDNHIDHAGGIAHALQRVHQYQIDNGLQLPIVIEVRNRAEVETVLHIGGVDRLLLDNMQPSLLRECVQIIGGRYQTEASGNINLQNARTVAETGVNFISLGMLTHSVAALDISLKIVK